MAAMAAWQVPAIALATIGVVGALAKAGYWLYRTAVGFDQWQTRMESSMKYVESEMRHNGGATMRDQLARVEIRVTEAAADRADLRSRLETIENNQAA